MSKVSVLVPTYNSEKFIKGTLERILRQDYDDFDVLVCDNGSSDNTVEVVGSIGDPRIRILRNETNIGIAGNWNRLLSEADGEYIIWVMSDDLLLDGALKKKAAILDKHKDVVIVTSSSNIVNLKEKKLYTRRPFKKNMLFDGKAFFKILFTQRNLLGECTNNMLRRDAALRAGGFRPELCYTIDWDYWLRVVCEGNVYYIDEPLSGFRVYGTSTTGKSTKESILDDEQLFLKNFTPDSGYPVTEKMISEREKNIRRRMNMRSVFIRMVTLFSR